MEQNSQRMLFDQFEVDWKRKHRTSIPRKVKTSTAREVFWIVFWLLVATGAAVFSAAHTIPAAQLTILKDVPFRTELATAVFFVVELVIFGAAAGRHDISWLKWLLLGAVLVALAGNIGSSIRAVSENGGDLINQFGGVLLAIIAPLTALAAGEVLHIQLDKRTDKRNAAQADYDQRVKEMETKILQAFKKYEKELDDLLKQEREEQREHERQLERERQAEISRDFMKLREDQIAREVSQDLVKPDEKPKPRVKLHEVANQIHENGDQKLTAAEMMEKYQISLGSTTKIREMLASRNGHSKPEEMGGSAR